MEDPLSLGEQQKIAFARLLLDRPAFAFLERGHEHARHRQRAPALRAGSCGAVDVVSVGRREGLLPFHVVLLELLGDGSGGSAGTARGFPPSDRHDRESFAVVGRRGSNDVWGVLYRPA